MTSSNYKPTPSKIIAVILYTFGAITCIAIWAILIWGDFEASLFATSLPADKHMYVKCPVVIASNEVGYFNVNFKNTTDRKFSTNVRTYISQGYMSFIKEDDTPLKLEPGEGKTLKWSVDSTGAVWNRLIMVRVYSFRQFPYLSHTGTCGILVIGQLPFSGDVLFYGILLVCVAALIGGSYLIKRQTTGRAITKPGILASLILLGVVVLLGLGLGALGNWLISFLLLILALLLMIVTLANRILEN